MGAELFHLDGRTDRQADMTKLIVAFCNCESASKNCWALSQSVPGFAKEIYYKFSVGLQVRNLMNPSTVGVAERQSCVVNGVTK